MADINDKLLAEAYDQLKVDGDLWAYAQVHQACDGGGYCGSAGFESGASVSSAGVDLVVGVVEAVVDAVTGK